MRMTQITGCLSIVGWVLSAGFAPGNAQAAAPSFTKAMIVIFENVDYAAAMRQPGFAKFSRDGASLANMYAAVHPSQGNYIALTAGSTYGVTSDSPVNLDVRHIGDLLEAKGKTWKIYLESYPGNCFTGTASGTYVRKHNPFISYANIQRDPARCNAHLVSASELNRDIQNGTLPDFSVYIPDMNNDGHDTGVAYADRWFTGFFGGLSSDAHFMKDMLVVATFDESSFTGGNHIYTAFYGDSVIAGSSATTRYSHASLLRTIEDRFGLGTLGRDDAASTAITGIWK